MIVTPGELPADDAVLNARGWKCPLPVLKAAKLLALAAPGEILRVEATDAKSMEDFREWAGRDATVELLDQREATDAGRSLFVHRVRRR
ncbi:MAG TPA: sulfurtransferase TusA family protein [bacterium]|nr:sulfurtransferase TusA family protein [bacterium]